MVVFKDFFQCFKHIHSIVLTLEKSFNPTGCYTIQSYEKLNFGIIRK